MSEPKFIRVKVDTDDGGCFVSAILRLDAVDLVEWDTEGLLFVTLRGQKDNWVLQDPFGVVARALGVDEVTIAEIEASHPLEVQAHEAASAALRESLRRLGPMPKGGA